MELPSDLMTVAEAAKLVGRHKFTIYNWVSTGKLASWKVHGRRLISRAELDRRVIFDPAKEGHQFKRVTLQPAE